MATKKPTGNTKFELKGKVGDTEVWVGSHRAPDPNGKILTFEVVVQQRYHQWYAWLCANNKGWDDTGMDYVSSGTRRTQDQEVMDTLCKAIDAVSDDKPFNSLVRVEGKSSEDARNRLISVVLRVAETLQHEVKSALPPIVGGSG